MLKEKITEYITEKYGAQPEYLWARFPGYAVFRHGDNRKWFAIVMRVKRASLGLKGDGEEDIINLKVPDPLFADILVQQPGMFRGYHIARCSWISVLLDGSVPFEEICRLTDESYIATASKEKKKQIRPPKEWIVPANPAHYDIERAFSLSREIDWKQGAGIKKGDTVFMYVAAPVSAILYKCKVTETDIPYSYSGKINIKALMKIKMLKKYPPEKFTFEKLRSEYGIYAVRGPRGVPGKLSKDLK